MDEENKLPPEELKTEKELDKQDKQEQKEQKKEENKKTLKTVVTSVICTLLFIIILLLLILLGLKKCGASVPDIGDDTSISSEPPSGPKYDYDTNKLNDKFLKIVESYMNGPGGMDPDKPVAVKVVTYTDNYEAGNFSLNISVISTNNKLYLYKAYKAFYPNDKSNFDNLISYLLLEDTPNIFTDGDLETDFSCGMFNPTTEVITTDKECHYVISNDTGGTHKYFDGYYYQDNQYNVYHHQEYIVDTNPFTNQPDMVVDLDHPLYGYYQELSKGEN